MQAEFPTHVTYAADASVNGNVIVRLILLVRFVFREIDAQINPLYHFRDPALIS